MLAQVLYALLDRLHARRLITPDNLPSRAA